MRAPYTQCSNYLEREDTWVSLYNGPLLLGGGGMKVGQSTTSLGIGMAEPSIVN